jgi:hypothetical protein
MGIEIYKTLVGYEVLMAMTMKSMVVCVVMPRRLERVWCFRETYPLQYVPPKQRHSVTTQKHFLPQHYIGESMEHNRELISAEMCFMGQEAGYSPL